MNETNKYDWGKMNTCPICKLNDDRITEKSESGGKSSYDCPRCGIFTITYSAMSDSTLPIGPKISAWIRNLNEHGSDVPEINPLKLEDIQKGLPDYGPREKQIILLQNIERKTEYPGKGVKILPKYDIPLAWALTQEEFIYYIDSLINRGLLRNIGDGQSVYRNKIGKLIYDSSDFSIEITANGCDYLEQHDRRIEERTKAFVAMSFKDELKAVWEAPIFNAITKAGYNSKTTGNPSPALAGRRSSQSIYDQ